MRLNAMIATLLFGAIFFVAGDSSAHAQVPENTKPVVNVVVAPGDSLSKIATAHQTTYVRLFDANTQIQDPDVIHPGDNVRIPDPSEQLASRPVPANAVAAPAAAPVVARKTAARPAAPAVAGGSVWDRLAQCESGGNWSINTGNGYYGGVQFSAATWRGVGGTGLPSDASREEQIARAQALQARSGWGQWPECSAKLGLR